MIIKLLLVAAIIGYIVWEIVKLNRDPELRSRNADDESRG